MTHIKTSGKPTQPGKNNQTLTTLGTRKIEIHINAHALVYKINMNTINDRVVQFNLNRIRNYHEVAPVSAPRMKRITPPTIVIA